jgi:hypothetical protein
MNEGKYNLSSAISEAAKPGPEFPPNELLDAVQALPDPFQALSDSDPSSALFDAFHRQFGSVRTGRTEDSGPEEWDRWVGFLRWLVRQLHEWSAQNDLRRERFTALLVAMRYCDLDDNLWVALPANPAPCQEFLVMLEQIVTRATFAVARRGWQSVPIWEEEVVKRLQEAELEQDWLKISELWPSFQAAQFPNLVLEQAVRCLNRFSFEQLVRATQGINQFAIAVQVADSLSVHNLLALGHASDNHFIQFACVFQFHQSRTTRLDGPEQSLLAQLFLKVTQDSPRWKKWMKVFNRYPLRYPEIQSALGIALAQAPDTAVRAYVEGIRLNALPNNQSRGCVAECLTAFRRASTRERCRTLWSLAFQRWSEWGFGARNEDDHLFEVSTSELDYGVVAYVIECMSEKDRSAASAGILGKLRAHDTTWHASLTGCITEWNRLLSEFQPYAHADRIAQSGDAWLSEGISYWPSALHGDRYFELTYNIRA